MRNREALLDKDVGLQIGGVRVSLDDIREMGRGD